MWVRSEYAGELAVLSAWVCALLPWSVTYNPQIGLYRIHFVYAFLQFLPSIDLGEAFDPYVLVQNASGFPESPTVAFGYELWLAAAVVFTFALVLSAVYYVYDDLLEERLPADPVRVMGVLLVGTALPLTAATYYLVTGSGGITVPVGVVFLYLLGGLLLVVDRT